MIRNPARIPARRRHRRAVSLLAIFGLLMSALMPLAHAAGGPAATLLAAICSPSGIHYVEIALDPAEPGAPQLPELGTLEHCPGCLAGSASAILPAAVPVLQPSRTAAILSIPAGLLANDPAEPGFQPRAPPATS